MGDQIKQYGFKPKNMSYIQSLTQYTRRKTIEVKIGQVPMGGNNPVRVQTMLNTDTNNVEATIAQSIRCIQAGAEYIRITAQGEKEALNLALIKEGLAKKGYHVPLIADIHFNPKAAEVAAVAVEKVRVNPGNYTDKSRLKPEHLTEENYQAEIERIKQRFVPLLEICKQNKTAIRIGTNHGSLSDRIMGRFGDTPEGMAESAMEFLRICKENNFTDVVLSMKASNTRIMVYATRLLVKKMQDEDMHFPVHLGVTEAGDGEDGRIKSAVGIGALLADGIGDTIRVSLTEDPEAELPVAKKIVHHFEQIGPHGFIPEVQHNPLNPYSFQKRKVQGTVELGDFKKPLVIVDAQHIADNVMQILAQCGIVKTGNKWHLSDQAPDYIIGNAHWQEINNPPIGILLPDEKNGTGLLQGKFYPLAYINNLFEKLAETRPLFVKAKTQDIHSGNIAKLKTMNNIVLLLSSDNLNKTADLRAAMVRLVNAHCHVPVVLCSKYGTHIKEDFQIEASCDMGGLLIDGLGDGLCLGAPSLPLETCSETAFQILQATGDRITKTEYISCPSCGRTHFNLMETLARIKERTAHLKSLKIGVMGCIVNGPGEMADAHYGYVGAGKDKITLYKGKQVIARGIPSEQAVDRLIELIKENGDWVEK
jgi:(E)-4-hydroxy-3-methylbut-2-enyl-diphosphate synthase